MKQYRDEIRNLMITSFYNVLLLENKTSLSYNILDGRDEL